MTASRLAIAFVAAIAASAMSGCDETSGEAARGTSERPDLERRVAAIEAAMRSRKAEPNADLARRLADIEESSRELRRQVAAMEVSIVTQGGAPLATQAAADVAAVTVIDTTFRVTEKNKTWWRIAWICRARNDSAAPVRFQVDVVLHDSAGFTIKDDSSTAITLAAHDVQEVTGFALVDAAVAENVTGVKATIDAR
jgi:hypothetical protein